MPVTQLAGSIGGAQGECQRKRCHMLFTPLQNQLPAVCPCDFASQTKAQTGTFDLTTAGFVGTVETVEHFVVILPRDRASRVRDREERLAGPLNKRHIDRATLVTELDGV